MEQNDEKHSMTRQDIEQHLQSALAAVTPDVWPKLDLSVPQDKPENISGVLRLERKLRRWGVAAACICLMAAGGIYHYEYLQVVSVVGIDVNPSLRLSFNRQEKVLKAEALNLDGAQVLDKELKGKPLKLAVGQVVDSLVEKGYLKEGEQEQAVLVSVSGKSEKKAETVKTAVTANIEDAIAQKQVSVVVYDQTIQVTEELEALAETYQVSVGKAGFVEQLVQENEALSQDIQASYARMMSQSMEVITQEISENAYAVSPRVSVIQVKPAEESRASSPQDNRNGESGEEEYSLTEGERSGKEKAESRDRKVSDSLPEDDLSANLEEGLEAEKESAKKESTDKESAEKEGTEKESTDKRDTEKQDSDNRNADKAYTDKKDTDSEAAEDKDESSSERETLDEQREDLLKPEESNSEEVKEEEGLKTEEPLGEATSSTAEAETEASEEGTEEALDTREEIGKEKNPTEGEALKKLEEAPEETEKEAEESLKRQEEAKEGLEEIIGDQDLRDKKQEPEQGELSGESEDKIISGGSSEDEDAAKRKSEDEQAAAQVPEGGETAEEAEENQDAAENASEEENAAEKVQEDAADEITKEEETTENEDLTEDESAFAGAVKDESAEDEKAEEKGLSTEETEEMKETDSGHQIIRVKVEEKVKEEPEEPVYASQLLGFSQRRLLREGPGVFEFILVDPAKMRKRQEESEEEQEYRDQEPDAEAEEGEEAELGTEEDEEAEEWEPDMGEWLHIGPGYLGRKSFAENQKI